MKRLLVLFLFPLVALADDWSPNLTLATSWQDNATNADRSSDRIDALQTQADLIAAQRYAFGLADSFHLTVHFGAEWWPRFRDLTQYAAGGRAEWRHTFGRDPLAPTVSAELGADALSAEDQGRRGTSAWVTLALRKRFNDTWRAAVTQEFARRDTHFAVYDRTTAQSTLEIGHDVNDVTRLTLAAFWRDGDVVSYATSPRPDLESLASHHLIVDTFRRPLDAFSVDARTFGSKLAWIRALDEMSAVIVSYEVSRTEHSVLHFVNQTLSLALVHQY